MAERWEPDFLGPGFFARTFSLPDDDEGAVVTTVVRYSPEASTLHAFEASVSQRSSEASASPGFSTLDSPMASDFRASEEGRLDAGNAARAAAGNAARAAADNAARAAAGNAARAAAGNAAPADNAARAAAGGEKSDDPGVEPEDRKAKRRNPAFAFLAVHGWNDYFYQTELARYVDSIGGAFYAVDLRKYGRSLREWQTFGYIRDFDEYDDELHVCRDLIYEELGPKIPLVLYGHSTGGLACALWADRHPGAAAGLVLNSPWLEYHGSTGMRQAGTPVVEILARTSPTFVLPTAEDDFYQRALTAWRPDPGTEAVPGHEGSDDPFWTTGWNPNPEFRTGSGAPVRPGWLSAVLNGHARVAAGLDVGCPILVLTSARSLTGNTWREDFRAVDSVLDVKQIWKRVPELGSHTTLVKLDDAVHDVTFSRREVRERAFEEIGRFLSAYVTDPARM